MNENLNQLLEDLDKIEQLSQQLNKALNEFNQALAPGGLRFLSQKSLNDFYARSLRQDEQISALLRKKLVVTNNAFLKSLLN